MSNPIVGPPNGDERSFAFLDGDLQNQLIALVKRAGISHRIDKKGVIHYRSADEQVMGNELICSIRSKVFTRWQTLSCPEDWVGRYRGYMERRRIPFVEELHDGDVGFLLSQEFRPHSWKRI